MKLSIIIVSFNTVNFLKKCLESIFRSDFPKNQREIIVVDNASKDGTKSFLRKNYPEVRLIAFEKNLGFAAANNQGVKNAKGEFILFLNPDTIVFPRALSLTTDFLAKNPQVGIVTCRVELPDGKIDDACHRGFPTPWNAFCYFLGLSSLFPFSRLFNGYHLGYEKMNSVHEIDSCSGAFMLVKKTVGEKVGWFDEDYFWYGEDLDFCFRIKNSGWKVMYLPQVKIIHYKGIASGIKNHSQKISTATRETKIKATQARFAVMRIFYRKHYQRLYPKIVTKLVLIAIRIKEIFALRSLLKEK